MGIDAKKVYVGLPEQSTTVGALSYGTVITTIPATYDAAATAITGFTSSGYISEDGATLTVDKSTTDIVDWAKNKVRRVCESVDGSISTDLIQLDENGAKQTFGPDNVTKTAANTTHGEQLKIAVGAHHDAPRAWALRIKDGDMKMIVLIPNGQVTSGVEITFVANEPIKLPITISANDDGTGTNNCLYIYTDDGQKTSA